MDRKIIRPTPHMRIGQNRQELIGGEFGIPDAANDFPAQSFVVMTAGALVAVASAGVLACGWSQDESKSSAAVNPPEAPFGDKHFPHNLTDMIFAVSVTNGSAHIGQTAGAPQLSAIAIGTSYGILRPTTGDYAGYQFLNSANTTNLFFIVVEKPSIWDGVKQDANTYNPVVLVRIVPAAIQAVG